MTLSVKNAGAWSTVKDLYIKQSGIWIPVKQGFVKNAGAWVEYYAAEVVVTIAANSTNVDLSLLFSGTDWAATKKKRVVVQSGVIIGSSNPNTPALRTGTGWGGELTLDNRGTIQGAGGAANSGVGGDAVRADTAGLIVNNAGIIRSGGGGGGKGGAGGSGYGNVATPPSYDISTHWWMNIRFESSYATFFAGSVVAWYGYSKQGSNTVPGPNGTIWNVDGQTFTRGAFVKEERSGSNYEDGFQYRQFFAVGRIASEHTSGGVGGDGGRGAGNDGAAAPGAAGASGGINAGGGGNGGSGGTYGAPGAPGAHGGAGTNGTGVDGALGGAAGIAYNAANITMHNVGTIAGRTA